MLKRVENLNFEKMRLERVRDDANKRIATLKQQLQQYEQQQLYNIPKMINDLQLKDSILQQQVGHNKELEKVINLIGSK